MARPRKYPLPTEPKEPTVSETPAAEQLVALRLDRNYRPAGTHEVVGYYQQEVKRKDLSGREIIIQRAEFVSEVEETEDGARRIKAAPPKNIGTGFEGRYLADTVIRLPRAEAIRANNLGIGRVDPEHN